MPSMPNSSPLSTSSIQPASSAEKTTTKKAGILRKTRDSGVKSTNGNGGGGKRKRRQQHPETALQRTQRHSVLEQLRTMVGGKEGSDQLEIVEHVIFYIGQLNQKLATLPGNDGIASGQEQSSSALISQLCASLALISRPRKAAQLPRAQRTR